MTQLTGKKTASNLFSRTPPASGSGVDMILLSMVYYLQISVARAFANPSIGGGTIDGNGQVWYDLFASDEFILRPTLIGLDHLHNAVIRDLNL